VYRGRGQCEAGSRICDIYAYIKKEKDNDNEKINETKHAKHWPFRLVLLLLLRLCRLDRLWNDGDYGVSSTEQHNWFSTSVSLVDFTLNNKDVFTGVIDTLFLGFNNIGTETYEFVNATLSAGAYFEVGPIQSFGKYNSYATNLIRYPKDTGGQTKSGTISIRGVQ